MGVDVVVANNMLHGSHSVTIDNAAYNPAEDGVTYLRRVWDSISGVIAPFISSY